jgi:hypothetical protein
MNKSVTLSMALFVTVLIGCSSPLHITNEDQYFSPPTPPLKEPMKLGITSTSDAHIQNSKYVSAIVDALQRSGNFEKVIHPFNESIHRDQVDAIVDITINPHYSGDGSNFFVSWPGFLIWAPAIWGYGYNAEIETAVNITRLKDGSQQIAVPTKYTFREAEMDRTWAAEMGWFLWSATALINGIFVTQYDTDVTDEFITKVSSSYGPYVAKKIEAALLQ